MNIPIENFTVISNIAKMREVITGGKFDIENSDLTSKTYDELHELQNSLIPSYNEAIKKKKSNKIENLIIKTGNEAAKANFMNVDYDDDNPMTLADCITYFITESLPDDQDFDSSEIYDFIESKLKD